MNQHRHTAAEYAVLLQPLLEQAASYAFSIVRHRADAEDAMQQAALRGLERLDTYRCELSFKGWWFAVLKNCCYDVLRDRSRQPQAFQDNAEALASPPSSNEFLTNALGRLSKDHAEILRLKYFAGLSYREIAQTLDVPQGTVMSRLHLARKALAAVMQREDR